MTLYLALIVAVFLLAANAFFVAAEFALVKVRSTRINTLAEEGNARAKLTKRILPNIESYLAACQLGITMASLGLGWIGEPAVAALLEPVFRLISLPPEVLHTAAFVIGFLVFSSLHIVVGEQVPKTIAIRESTAAALWIAWPLHVFYLACYPFNWLLNRASGGILRLMGAKPSGHGEAYSPEELRSLIVVSHAQGTVEKVERDMLGGVLDLEDVEVGQIMTHRTHMATIDAERPLAEIIEQVRKSPFTRFPIWRGDPDSLIGVIHAKDVLALAWDQDQDRGGAAFDLASIAAPPWFIPDTTSLRHQLLAFRQRREHLAIVVDEYGAIQGLVTLEDVLEEIVGEIADEKDVEVSGVRQQEDGSVLVEGRVPVRDLNRQFGWALPEEEAATVAGLVIHEARRIPEVGRSYDFHGFRFDVLRRKGHQVTLLKVERRGEAEAT